MSQELPQDLLTFAQRHEEVKRLMSRLSTQLSEWLAQLNALGLNQTVEFNVDDLWFYYGRGDTSGYDLYVSRVRSTSKPPEGSGRRPLTQSPLDAKMTFWAQRDRLLNALSARLDVLRDQLRELSL